MGNGMDMAMDMGIYYIFILKIWYFTLYSCIHAFIPPHNHSRFHVLFSTLSEHASSAQKQTALSYDDSLSTWHCSLTAK